MIEERKPKPPSASQKERDATDAAYARLFATRDGETVLKDLTRKYYDARMDGADLSRDVGQRDVVLWIKQRIS